MEWREVQAGDFKENFSELMPADDGPASSFGTLAGSVTLLGDIVTPLDVAWEADT